MIVTVVIIAVTFFVVVGVMLAYWPKGISVNENDQILLSTYIGKSQLIPVDDISITELPEGILNHLIRTNGMALAKSTMATLRTQKPGRRCSTISPVRKAESALLTVIRFLLYLRDSARFLSHEKTTPA